MYISAKFNIKCLKKLYMKKSHYLKEKTILNLITKPYKYYPKPVNTSDYICLTDIHTWLWGNVPTLLSGTLCECTGPLSGGVPQGLGAVGDFLVGSCSRRMVHLPSLRSPPLPRSHSCWLQLQTTAVRLGTEIRVHVKFVNSGQWVSSLIDFTFWTCFQTMILTLLYCHLLFYKTF